MTFTRYFIKKLLNSETHAQYCKELIELSNHNEKSHRHSACKISLDLVKKQHAYLHQIAYYGLRKPKQEACCNIRSLKVMGLSALIYSPSISLRVQSVDQLLELTNDPSNIVRFSVVTALASIINYFNENLPSVKNRILHQLSPLTNDPHPWIQDTVSKVLNSNELESRVLFRGGPHI